MRKRRLDLGLLQREAAARIGVDETTIYNWETHHSSPQIRHLPRIIAFLGYNPLPVPQTLPGKLRGTRQALGLSQKDMARRIGVDAATLARWESGKNRPSRKLCEK